MAQTIESVILDGVDWINANEATGIAVGKPMIMQNQSSSPVMMAISTTKPDIKFRGILLPTDLSINGTVSEGESTVWLYGSGPVSVQEG